MGLWSVFVRSFGSYLISALLNGHGPRMALTLVEVSLKALNYVQRKNSITHNLENYISAHRSLLFYIHTQKMKTPWKLTSVRCNRERTTLERSIKTLFDDFKSAELWLRSRPYHLKGLTYTYKNGWKKHELLDMHIHQTRNIMSNGNESHGSTMVTVLAWTKYLKYRGLGKQQNTCNHRVVTKSYLYDKMNIYILNKKRKLTLLDKT